MALHWHTVAVPVYAGSDTYLSYLLPFNAGAASSAYDYYDNNHRPASQCWVYLLGMS